MKQDTALKVCARKHYLSFFLFLIVYKLSKTCRQHLECKSFHCKRLPPHHGAGWSLRLLSLHNKSLSIWGQSAFHINEMPKLPQGRSFQMLVSYQMSGVRGCACVSNLQEDILVQGYFFLDLHLQQYENVELMDSVFLKVMFIDL